MNHVVYNDQRQYLLTMSNRLASITELNIPFVKADNTTISIDTPVLNGHFFLYFIYFVFLTAIFFSTSVLGFQIVSVIVSFFAIWKVWDIFNFTNKVEIHFNDKVVVKRSKNVIKRLLGIDNNVVYNFSEIEEFEPEYLEHSRSIRDHVVRMVLNNGSAVAITTVYKEEQADELARVLNRLVR